ncbi:MAG: hypothetical protein PQJ45_00395 [Sphaerochaetaceae bacterium]|nr:hypothetical protein [Sphaerochaetaceae bacterium]
MLTTARAVSSILLSIVVRVGVVSVQKKSLLTPIKPKSSGILLPFSSKNLKCLNSRISSLNITASIPLYVEKSSCISSYESFVLSISNTIGSSWYE